MVYPGNNILLSNKLLEKLLFWLIDHWFVTTIGNLGQRETYLSVYLSSNQ